MVDICFSKRNGHAVLKLSGELTIYSVTETRKELQGRLEKLLEIPLDLSGITILDAAGAQLLLWLRQMAHSKGHELSFLNHSPAVREAFDLLNLTTLFEDPTLHTPREF